MSGCLQFLKCVFNYSYFIKCCYVVVYILINCIKMYSLWVKFCSELY